MAQETPPERQSAETREQKNERIKKARGRAQQLARVAKSYYQDNRTQKQILDEDSSLTYKDPSSINRLLREARESGIVVFDIDASFGFSGRPDSDLSRTLRDGFALSGATAVNVAVTDPYDHSEDDYLNTALGNCAGKAICERIEPRDHIAVGPGRAVYQCVRMIRRLPRSCKGLEITPLSGRFWAHSWETSGPYITRPLDADDAAFVLELAFEKEPGTKFRQVANPLFAHSREDAEATMKSHCPFLPGGQWRWGSPRKAIVGIGVVDPGAHLVRRKSLQPRHRHAIVTQLSARKTSPHAQVRADECRILSPRTRSLGGSLRPRWLSRSQR